MENTRLENLFGKKYTNTIQDLFFYKEYSNDNFEFKFLPIDDKQKLDSFTFFRTNEMDNTFFEKKMNKYSL
jgi:hypothetical protein